MSMTHRGDQGFGAVAGELFILLIEQETIR
jgi:hypothetical protein